MTPTATPSPQWEDDPYVKANPETQEFWRAAAEARFLLPRCRACGQHHWHPRIMCPMCGGADLEWIQASGRGSVFSFTVMRTAAQPFVLAYVQLEEGPVLLTHVIDCPFEAVHVGQAVEVRWRKTDEGRCVPVFAPAIPPR
jgi:uncharacterized protein